MTDQNIIDILEKHVNGLEKFDQIPELRQKANQILHICVYSTGVLAYQHLFDEKLRGPIHETTLTLNGIAMEALQAVDGHGEPLTAKQCSEWMESTKMALFLVIQGYGMLKTGKSL